MEIRFYERTAQAMLETKQGLWKMLVYRHRITGVEHVALVSPEMNPCSSVFVRIHSSCVTGDIFGVLNCDCREQLKMALEAATKDKGIVFYLFQEGRGIGLTNKIKAYAFKEAGYDTVEANLAIGLPDDCRSYEMVGEILKDLQVKKVKLMTNSPSKINAVKSMGIKVERVSAETKPTEYNKKYLETRKEKNGHLLNV